VGIRISLPLPLPADNKYGLSWRPTDKTTKTAAGCFNVLLTVGLDNLYNETS
jgi:hypothetical protein